MVTSQKHPTKYKKESENKKEDTANRRREDRLPGGSDSKFLLRSGKKVIECKTVNLSRLGLGVELPIDGSEELYTELSPDVLVSGVLHVGNRDLEADAIIRVRRGSFLGLEYVVQSSDFINNLRNLLSPKYIANSIYQLSSKILAGDIETAYRGDEFECLIFKPGASGTGKAIQFFCGGRFVEVVGDKARFVPAPLIRTTGGTGALDFVLQFASLENADDKKAMKMFFNHLEAIFHVWKDAPKDLAKVVHEQALAFK